MLRTAHVAMPMQAAVLIPITVEQRFCCTAFPGLADSGGRKGCTGNFCAGLGVPLYLSSVRMSVFYRAAWFAASFEMRVRHLTSAIG